MENVTGRCDEIERKWIVDPQYAQYLISTAGESFDIDQGYFGDKCRVRVNRGSITNAVISIKIGITLLTRAEFNYPIPLDDAETLLQCIDTLSKRRHNIGNGFTIDEFFGKLTGFYLIEKEYDSEEAAEEDDVPSEWVGAREVTNDTRYTNATLLTLTWADDIGLFVDDPVALQYGGDKFPPHVVASVDDVAHLIVTGDGDDLMPEPLIIP